MRATTILLLAGLLAGCSRSDEAAPAAAPTGTADASAPGLPNAAPAATSPADAHAARVRFRCADGHRVELVDGSARVTLRSGTVVLLPRSTRATGTLYAGEALEFTVVGEGAQLAQDEGAHWACTAE